jgi:hypothetical protein
MDYTNFLSGHLIPALESELNSGSSLSSHVCLMITKKNQKEKTILEKIEKYDEDENGVLFTDSKILPPYDLSTHEHIIKKNTRMLYPEVIITSTLNETPHKEQMNDFFDMFENKIDIKRINDEVIISVESYEKNERFLYKLEKGQLVLKDTLAPLDRIYLPYLN